MSKPSFMLPVLNFKIAYFPIMNAALQHPAIRVRRQHRHVCTSRYCEVLHLVVYYKTDRYTVDDDTEHETTPGCTRFVLTISSTLVRRDGTRTHIQYVYRRVLKKSLRRNAYSRTPRCCCMFRIVIYYTITFGCV